MPVGETLAEILDDQAAHQPAQEALVYTDRKLRYSFQRLREGCDRIARGLLRIGVGQGDHVAVWAANVPEWVVLQLAIAKVGATIVPLPTAYGAKELEAVLRDSEARALVAGPTPLRGDPLETVKAIMPELESCPAGQLHSERLPQLRSVVTLGENRHAGVYHFKDLIDLAEVVDKEELRRAQARLRADQTAALLYEVDSSGQPYGALLTHANLRHVALAVGERMRVTEKDRVLLPVPLSDVFGLVVGSVLSLLHGATLIPFVEFRPRLVLEATAKERGTVLIGTPTMFQQELEEKRFLELELDSLRAGIIITPIIDSSSEGISPGLFDRVRDELVISELTTAFGLRETASVITLSRREDAPGKRRHTAGTPLPDVEVRIVDPSTRAGLAAGETGVIAVRGPSLMKGYYKRPEETSRVMDSGWLYTRQRGSLDPDGSLRLVAPES